MFPLACLLVLSVAFSRAEGLLRLEQAALVVQTRTLEVKFDRGAVTSVQNRLTGEQYIQRAGPRWFEMTQTSPPTGALSEGAWTLGEAPGGGQLATIEFAGVGQNLSLSVTVNADDEIVLKMSGHADTPGVISTTWGIYGLKMAPGRLVIPGQAGTYFDEHSDIDVVGLDYPVHWEHRMFVYEGGVGSLLVYSADDKPRFQRLKASRQTGALDVAVEMFATAPFKDASEVETREWRLAAFAGGWREPAVTYKSRMTQWNPLVPPTGAREWIREIRGVVIFLNSETALLDKVAKEVIPSKTLIHFVDWRKQPFDFGYPDYTPSDAAKIFVDHAHKLGFRVMVHTNLLGVSEVDTHYAQLSQYQMRRADDLRQIGWLWEEFAPGSPRRVAYISPASSEYRKTFVDSLQVVIDQLKPDAIHLDAGGALINDGNGLIEGMNTMEGVIQLHKDLINAYPDIVWGGESTNEIIGPYNWLAQRWASNYSPHPMGNFLLGDQVFFYGFLDQPSPDEPNFLKYLKRYEGQGVLPAVIVVNADDLGPDRERTFELLRQLRRWQEKQYRPAWDRDWESSVFRLESADGASSASIETSGNFIQLIEDGQTTYERVRNTNRATTPLFIDRWLAYDETSLLGLDPNNEYWLTGQPSRPSALVHLQQIPENFRIGTGSFAHSRYGYFELEGAPQTWFDFVSGLPGAKIGTLYNGKDYPLMNGAFVGIGRALIGGELKNTALFSLPPSRGNINGATFVDYRIAIPVVPQVELEFSGGVGDALGHSDGALFGVQVNGATLWRKTIAQGKLEAGSIDLTSFAGTTVSIRFLTNAGQALNPNFDLALWSDVRLKVDFAIPSAPITLGVPTGSAISGVTEGLTVDAVEAGLARAHATLPGRFAVFLEDPPAIGLGESLLDFPYEVWKWNYGGFPLPFSVEGSGSIEAATSGGVTRPLALVAVPPRNGSTIITTAVTIPEGANSLLVEYGVIDPPASYGPDFKYSGLEFSLQINGENLFSEEVQTGGWRSRRIELDAYRGKRVLIQLKTDAQNLSLYDWARWANLTVQ